jgi:gliding motility-associated lipoprotein GldD
LTKVPDETYDCWYDLKYLPFNATLHLSYKQVFDQSSLDSLTEDAYKMAFDHLSKAEEIIEREIYDSALGLYGMIYDLEGKTATPFNFYLTDKKNHFFRGSFYFNEHTDKDSVAPIYDFLRKDIMHSIETFRWKSTNSDGSPDS